MVREFKIADVCLGEISIPDALDLVFSYDTMKEIHGPNTVVGPWNHAGERQVKYDFDASEIRHPFKRFMADRVAVVASQTMKEVDERSCVVDSRVRTFARLICIGASFKLERKGEPEKTYFSGEAKVNVTLPGLKKMTEALLIDNAEKEMRRYVAHVQAKAGALQTIAQIFNAHPALFNQV